MFLLAILLAICLASILAAWGFRVLGIPGHRIIPGLIVGVMMGPALLGRIAPDSWEQVFAGGVDVRSELRSMDREHSAWQRAAGATTTNIDHRIEKDTEHLELRAPLVEAERIARESHQQPWTILTTLLALLAALMAIGCSARTRRGPSDQLIGGIALGAWAAVVPVLGVILLARGLGFDTFSSDVLLLCAAVAIGPWSLGPTEARIASRTAPHPGTWPQTAARTATVVSLAIAIAASFESELSWGVVAIAGMGLLRLTTLPRLRRALRGLRDCAILPALGAMAILMTDVILDARFWPMLGVAVLCSDGRWLGAGIGFILRGGPVAKAAMRGAIIAVDAAGPQLAITAIATALGLISGAWTTSLLFGVLVLELTSPLRKTIDRYLREVPT